MTLPRHAPPVHRLPHRQQESASRFVPGSGVRPADCSRCCDICRNAYWSDTERLRACAQTCLEDQSGCYCRY